MPCTPSPQRCWPSTRGSQPPHKGRQRITARVDRHDRNRCYRANRHLSRGPAGRPRVDPSSWSPSPVNLSAPTALDADLERQGINVIRALAMDGPHKAKSGHQGTAMALAPWPTCCSRASSATTPPTRPGPTATDSSFQPVTPRSFTTRCSTSRVRGSSGPTSSSSVNGVPSRPVIPKPVTPPGSRSPPVHLGQGLGNGVGMALAERTLRAAYGPDITNHHTFVIAGDGCLSEGISHEAASLAGHLGLGRLVVVYDDNHVTIDGPTELSLSDDAAARFAGYGWDVHELGEAAERPRRPDHRSGPGPRGRGPSDPVDRPLPRSASRRPDSPATPAPTAIRSTTPRSQRRRRSWASPPTSRSTSPNPC